ncbi:hypothetical protein [Brevibacillus sp. SYSU BS000544]|uniref:hypothetical protein n=1 Tax=Brevibacillus sp. SYSU BS000544 TaxID=3416443 RepID=UPI003CE550AD
MFHPIVYDNIRVVLEGAVYDRDLDGEILVLSRADVVDLATFHRYFHIEFYLGEEVDPDKKVTSQIQLKTSLADIASEQLEQSITDHIGCTICIHFTLHITDVVKDTEKITKILNDIWGHRPHITQEISTHLDEHKQLQWPPAVFKNRITLDFHRKIDEGNIEDMQGLVEHSIESLERLHRLVKVTV